MVYKCQEKLVTNSLRKCFAKAHVHCKQTLLESHQEIFLKFFEQLFSRTVANDDFCIELFWNLQKQPPRDVPRKKCSDNMQQIYRRTPMQKLLCNFNEITLYNGCSPVNLLHLFRTPFLQNTSGWLLLNLLIQLLQDPKSYH